MRMVCIFIFAAIHALTWLTCVERCRGQIVLRDFTEARGIADYVHFAGQTGKNYLVETITTGLATFDFDNDGLIDVYLPSGSALPGSPSLEQAPCNRLFKNIGNAHFVDVTESSGAGDLRFAMGVIAADYDNDGDQDVVIANYGECVLLENNSDGTFSSRLFPNTVPFDRIAAGLTMADFDLDGFLDLYIANYVKFDFREVRRQVFGVSVASGPLDFSADTHLLFKNKADGTFEDVTLAAGIASSAGPGMGVVSFDYNVDGLPDVFVCNDSAANFLWENQGDFRFQESAQLAGVAYGPTGAAQASMGADVGDVDRDGLLDLVATNFSEEVPNIFINSGQGYFDDHSLQMGLGRLSRPVTWGIGLSDFDNDGYLDLFIGAGHLGEHLEAANTANQARLPNYLLKNDQGRKFIDVDRASPDVKQPQITRGIAVDDFDHNGLCDVVVLNMNDRAQLLLNTTEQHGNFLAVELIGRQGNRDAIGTLLDARLTGERPILRSVHAGRGYQSCFGRRVHFGLGNAQHVAELLVRWPGGKEQIFKDIPVNCCIQVREGEGSWHVAWSAVKPHAAVEAVD